MTTPLPAEAPESADRVPPDLAHLASEVSRLQSKLNGHRRVLIALNQSLHELEMIRRAETGQVREVEEELAKLVGLHEWWKP